MQEYWHKCPVCGYPKMFRLRSDTRLVNFPGYCKRCKTESIITIEPKSQIVELNDPPKMVHRSTRKGIKQIRDNPGGIILDYRNRNISFEKIMNVVDGRMKRGFDNDTDIMIILSDTEVKVYRYKK